MISRRSFLSGILAACAAPAIVRADSLMRIVPMETTVIPAGWAPGYWMTKDELAALYPPPEIDLTGMVREMSQYDIYRDETITRWDVLGIGPSGLPIQLGVDMVDIKPGDRDIAIATLRAHATREGLKPRAGVLEIPPGMRGQFV